MRCASVIEPLQDERKNEGAVKLVLVREPTSRAKGSVSFDNYNSRYLGPYEGIASYDASIMPLQETSVSGLSSVPPEKLKYFNASHTIAITADLSAQLYAGYTKAHPGFTLAPDQVESDARNFGVSLKKQFIRQRQENLSASLIFDAKNNSTDVLQAPLTRDRVRAVRGNAAYDRERSAGRLRLRHLRLKPRPAGAERQHRRRGADLPRRRTSRISPRLEYSLNAVPAAGGRLDGRHGVERPEGLRRRSIPPSSSATAARRSGGPTIPREILGDNGVAGSLELRYSGLPPLGKATFSPFGFYDIGKVWSEGVDGQVRGIGRRRRAGGFRLRPVRHLHRRQAADPASWQTRNPATARVRGTCFRCYTPFDCISAA